MIEKAGILGGDDRLSQYLGDVVVADDDPLLGRELPDLLAAGRIHPRDGVWRVVVKRRHLRQVSGIGEHHAADASSERRHDKDEDTFGLSDEWVGGLRHVDSLVILAVRGALTSQIADQDDVSGLDANKCLFGRSLRGRTSE